MEGENLEQRLGKLQNHVSGHGEPEFIPTLYDYIKFLGIEAFRKGDYKNSILNLEMAYRIIDLDEDLSTYLAMSYDSAGNYLKAIPYYDKAIDMPRSADADFTVEDIIFLRREALWKQRTLLHNTLKLV